MKEMASEGVRSRRAPLRVAALIAICLGLGLGCAGPPCPESGQELAVAVPPDGVKPTCAEVRLDADQLYDRAVAELRAGQLEMGYRYLALVHVQDPHGEKDREAFLLATRVFRKLHFRHRTEADSVWVRSQPRFMFAWLAGFFRGRDGFPQDEMNAMFLGMHYQMFRDFLAWAKQRANEEPDLVRWTITAEKDDGRIESVVATPSDTRRAGTP